MKEYGVFFVCKAAMNKLAKGLMLADVVAIIGKCSN